MCCNEQYTSVPLGAIARYPVKDSKFQTEALPEYLTIDIEAESRPIAIVGLARSAIQAFSMAIANKINATAISANRAKVCIYLPLVEGRQRMSFLPTATTRERTPDGQEL